MTTVRILYFAAAREKIGQSEEELALPPGIANLGQLRALLARRHPILAQASIRGAVNQVFATADTPIAAGDEIAFFPPTTGG
jgi:molybdopterin synthase sulfur carrier subunit